MGAAPLINSTLDRPLLSDCQNCSFGSWRPSAKITSREAEQFDEIVAHRRVIKRNEYLHNVGTALDSLYVINSGFLKSSITDGNNHEQVVAFYMPGDIFGLDAIDTGRHQCATVALEDSSICEMRYFALEKLRHTIPALQQLLQKVMGAEIVRAHNIMLLLGAMRAEQRVAAFLLDLSKRFFARGYSGTQFRLPMARHEIGSYLGLTIESVSRTLSRLDATRIISINYKFIEIVSAAKLHRIAGTHEMRGDSRSDAQDIHCAGQHLTHRNSNDGRSRHQRRC